MDNKVQWKVAWLGRNWLLALLLLVATFVAYQPVWHFGYIKGEGIDNDLNSWQGLHHIWTQQGEETPDVLKPWLSKAYYPLTYTTYWLEYRLWGMTPLVYFLDNVLLHGLNAVVLWLILRRLSVPGAWLGAALWALHPVNVESVASIAERKNTLSGLFYLCSLLAALKYWLPEQVEGQRSRSGYFAEGSQSFVTSTPTEAQRGPLGFFWVALVLYVLSLLSKTTTIPLPVVVLLLVWWKRNRLLWRDVRPLLIFPIMGIAMGLDTMHVEHNLSAMDNFKTEFSLPLVDRFLIAGRDVWFYLGKLVWPHPLIFKYPLWKIDPSSVMAWLQLLAVPALLCLLWLKRNNWGRPVLVALLYFLILLAPVLSFMNAMFLRRSFVADHYQYLACMGPLTLAAAGIVTFFARLGKAGYVLRSLLSAGLLSVLGLLTWNQCRIYTDLETFYKTTLTLNPDAWQIRNDLAVLLSQKGQLDAAIQQYQMLLALHPDPEICHNLGIAYSQIGRQSEATAYFQEAIKMRPDYAIGYSDLGNQYLQEGQVDAAMAYLQEALRIEPNMPTAWYNLGNVYVQKGQLDLAIQSWQKAVTLQPDYAAAHGNLGNAFSLKGQMAEAIQHWRSALATEPNLVSAQMNLAWVLATCPQASLRNGADAVQLAERADELTGGRNPVVLRTLAAACAENGDFPDAVAAAQHALQDATLQGNRRLAADLQGQLKFYQNNQPFRDTTMMK